MPDVNKMKKYLFSIVQSKHSQTNNLQAFFFAVTKIIDVNITDKQGNTLLHHAIQNNHFRLAKILLELNADLNQANFELNTPLHFASLNQCVGMTQLLLEYHANINIANYYHNTPLHLAVDFGENLATVECLIKKGAYIDQVDENFRTALHIASINGNLPMLRKLITLGAKETVVDNHGNTLLHTAAMHGNQSIIEYLLDRGADIEARDVANATVLHVALKAGNFSCVDFLLKKNANINSVDNYGNTPLHWAVINKNPRMVKLLLKNEATIKIFNYDNDMPVHLAVQHSKTAEDPHSAAILKLFLKKLKKNSFHNQSNQILIDFISQNVMVNETTTIKKAYHHADNYPNNELSSSNLAFNFFKRCHSTDPQDEYLLSIKQIKK